MAVRVECLPKNPSSLCILSKATEQSVTPMNKPKQKRLPNILKGKPFDVLYLTVMCIDEVTGLARDCAEFGHGTLHITKQLVPARRTGDKTCFGQLKNGKTRVAAPVHT